MLTSVKSLISTRSSVPHQACHSGPLSPLRLAVSCSGRYPIIFINRLGFFLLGYLLKLFFDLVGMLFDGSSDRSLRLDQAS